MDSRGQIENLMARYCRTYDEGDLDSYAELFRHGTISGMSDHDEIVAFHRENVFFYDGKPQTRHVVSNIEIEIDEEAGTADGRSYLTCYQALPDYPFRPLFVGSYIDKFARIDGEWHFADRQFEMHLLGDISRHGRPGTVLPNEKQPAP